MKRNLIEHDEILSFNMEGDAGIQTLGNFWLAKALTSPNKIFEECVFKPASRKKVCDKPDIKSCYAFSRFRTGILVARSENKSLILMRQIL